MMASYTSYGAAPSSNAPASDVVVRAYKAEIQQLRDTLHELAVRDSSSGTPGFTEVLEGKYLAQIKKNKTFSVQLGTAQQQLAEAQKALQIEREKTARLVAAATFTGVPSSKEKKDGNRGRGGGGANASTATEGDDEDVKGTESTSAALQRVYGQLHQRDLTVAETQRENAALRQLVQREVGLRDDTGEVDALLKRTSTTTTATNNVGEGGTAVSAGWRGRAEELVLLRSKLKDAQRRAEAMAAAVEGAPYDLDDGAGSETLALPASVRAYLGMAEAAHSEGRTTIATAATGVSRRRDVDDDARDRLTTLQQQRAAQQRQSAIDGATQQRQLQEEKLRTAALQARVKTLKTELDTLRAYVETILDKSTTDDELVEAYKAELRATQEEVRQWQKKAAVAAAAVTNANSGGGGSPPSVGLHNAATAVATATAAARSAPYRKGAQQQQQQSGVSPDTPPPSSCPPEQRQTALKDADAVVYEWVRRACEESPEGRKGGTAAEAPTVPTPATCALAAVLRSAMRHVAEVERGAADASPPASSEGGSAAQVEEALVTENAALKKRIRALTVMMEREMQAQKVLWSSRGGVDGGDRQA